MSSFDIPSPRANFVDANMKISREWNMFLQNVFSRIGGSNGDSIDAIKVIINQLLLENGYREIDEAFAPIPASQANMLDPFEGSANALEILKKIEEIRTQISMLPDSSAALAEANKIIATKAASALDAWTTPTLLNSWVNFGGGFFNAGFYKDPFGIVHLRGVIASGVLAQAAFVLPAGYIPTSTVMVGVNSNDAMGRLHIDTTGQVIPRIGSNVFFTLDSITFRPT